MLIPIRGWMIWVILVGLLGADFCSRFKRLPLPTSNEDKLWKQLAERWAQKVSSEVKQFRGRPNIAVARVVNDVDGVLSRELKRWISRRNVLMTNDRWYDELCYMVGAYQEPRTLDEACKPLVSSDVNYIIAAEILTWVTFPEFEARLVGKAQIRNGQTKELIREFQISVPEVFQIVETPPQTLGVHDEKADVRRSQQDSSILKSDEILPKALVGSQSDSRIHGFIVWILLIISGPFAVSSSLRQLLRRRHNSLNLILMAGYILFITCGALFLWLGKLPIMTALLVGTLSISLATVYFGYLCSCLEKAL